jgi:hypothetical protein
MHEGDDLLELVEAGNRARRLALSFLRKGLAASQLFGTGAGERRANLRLQKVTSRGTVLAQRPRMSRFRVARLVAVAVSALGGCHASGLSLGGPSPDAGTGRSGAGAADFGVSDMDVSAGDGCASHGPPCQPKCADLQDGRDCIARGDCYPVFTSDEPCNNICCASHFARCEQGYEAHCRGTPVCQLLEPNCVGPFVVAYSGSCYDGCVLISECAPSDYRQMQDSSCPSGWRDSLQLEDGSWRTVCDPGKTIPAGAANACPPT